MKYASMKKLYKRYVFIIAALLHLAIVLYITLIDRIPGERRCMLTPFWEIRNVINGTERSFYIGQIIGNLLMLFPTGFLLTAIFKCKKIRWYHVASTALLFSLFIEITQYFTGRGLMEFDDVFNNTVGCLLGYAVYLIIRRRINNRK